MKVLILHDAIPEDSAARPDETDALVQAQVVERALNALGHSVETLGVTLDLETTIAKITAVAPDLVFNLIESLGGHGRLIHVLPGVLETFNIPFTGSGSAAQFATSGKLIAKQIMHGAGIPTPRWFAQVQLASDMEIPAGRYIIKSVWEHASVGLDEDSVIELRESAAGGARLRLRDELQSRLECLGGEGFVEQFIEGREFNLALLADRNGPQLLPPAEIVFDGYDADKPRVVGWRAKWEENSFEFHHTPRRFEFEQSDTALIVKLRAIALQCWNLFELRGHARVDFRVDSYGNPWVLEVNTNPCLSPDAGFAAALDRAGLSLIDAVKRILVDTYRTRSLSAVNTPTIRP